MGYKEVYGLREHKYDYLRENDLQTTEWVKLQPCEPHYFFVEKDFALQEEYEKFWMVPDIFPVNNVGLFTARDNLTIKFSTEDVLKTVRDFSSLPEDVARSKYSLGKDVRDWKVSFAQNDLKKSGLKKELIIPILYRPFDIRYTYYTGHSRGFICMPRPKVMKHILNRENIGLTLTRGLRDPIWQHVYVTPFVTDKTLLSSRDNCYFFPLYCYHGATFKPERIPNFNNKFLRAAKKALNMEPTPEEIFHYIYAVLYSPTYRTRYEEFLKIDFSRIPLTSDKNLFETLSRLGSELVSLHLMESPELDDLITEFRGGGDNVVAPIGKNSYKDGRLKINKTQYFEGMPEEVYNFHIGGYQVCQKWLKDRKGRALSEGDIFHYQKIVVALNETIRIMKEIDEAIDGHGGWPIR